jgi:hypothetical protein
MHIKLQTARRSNGRVLLSTLTVVLLASIARADGPTPFTPTPFTTVVRAHFQEWSGSSDAISPAQLDHLLKQRKYRDEAAAALAVMKINVKDPGTKQPVAWTLRRIEQYEAKQLPLKNKKAFDQAFKKAQAAIKAAPHTLFVAGAPHLSAIHQGRNGNCWLLSTIGAMISRNPDEVRKLIHDEGGGQYTVHFARHNFKVRGPTDAEIATYTADGADGDWLYVIESAIGQCRENYNHATRVVEAADEAMAGGSGPLAFQDILGRDCDRVAISPQKPQHDVVRRTLTRAFNQRLLVILGTGGEAAKKLPQGISHGHAMALIGWDAARDTVTIWNPWGNNFEPKGNSPGDGYKTVNGVFSMPVVELQRGFLNIDIESEKPYRAKK